MKCSIRRSMSAIAQPPGKLLAVVDRAVARLKETLGANLYSCLLYGSLVRGDAVEGASDANLMIVLEASTPEAHAAIADVLREAGGPIEPMVLARGGFERSARAFAIKFRSAARHYRVLAGADPLARMKFDEAHLRFLCEQALRNLDLRLVHAFVTFGHDGKRYGRYLAEMTPAVFTDVCEPLRCMGADLPADFAARIPAIERAFGVDGAILRDLLALKAAPRALGADEAKDRHARLFRLIDKVVNSLEEKWRAPGPITAT